MKIYFCDSCNESIPLEDIKSNQAATLNGKIYCRNCNPIKDVPQGASRPSSPMALVCLLILVAILLGVLIGLHLFVDREPDVEYATAASLLKTNQLLTDLNSDFSTLKADLTEFKTFLTTQQESLGKIESDLMLQKGDLLGTRSEIDNIVKNFKSVTLVRERLDGVMLKQGEFGTTLDSILRNVEIVEDRLSGMEARIEKMKSSGGLVAGVNGSSTTGNQPPVVGDSGAVRAIREKLESKDDGVRFEAVYQVLDDRLKEALPYVKPLIHDPDQFVQLGAIQTVGEFLYMDALTDLVKVLRDPDVTVRDEALRQLIHMSGKNDLQFNVRGSNSEREKAVKKWETWLKSRG